MNQTEAYETVLQAAKFFRDANRVRGGTDDIYIDEGHGNQNLKVAIRKVAPRVARMRKRLDAQRAKNKPKPFNGPGWLRAAIDSAP